MPILHKNITASADIHNPKWFGDANNGDYAWKNEQGNLEAIDELLLPAALNFVDASVAPPTSNTGDIYVLSSGGSVHVDWGSVSVNDWVRYDGASWNSITPQKSSLCYNENLDALNSFNGLAWVALGGDSIYTADSTIGSGRIATLTDTLTFDGGTVNIQGANTSSTSTALAIYDGYTIPAKLFDVRNNGDIYISNDGTNHSKFFANGDVALGSDTIIGVQAGICLHKNTLIKSESNLSSNTAFQVVDTGNSSIFRLLGNKTLLFRGDSPVSTETISLQGSTLIKGEGTTTGTILALCDNDTIPNKKVEFFDNGQVSFYNLPTSSAGLSSGDLWNDSGTLKIV